MSDSQNQSHKDETACPICQLPGRELTRRPEVDSFDCWCRRCGEFSLTGRIVRTPRFTPSLAPYLSAYIRQSNRAGTQPKLLPTNWIAFAELHKDTPITKKAQMLLEDLSQRSVVPGKHIELALELDYPLYDASSEEEATVLVESLQEDGLIKGKFSMGYHWHGKLTMAGWQSIEGFSKTSESSNRCFIAMWLSPDMDLLYHSGIEKAVQECGYDPIRVDLKEFNEKICDRILADIRKCKFIVADFTGHRGGVYFEVGFAMGLGKPAIFTCRDDCIKEAHFDTNHYNHIVWKTPDDLYERLVSRIKATIPKDYVSAARREAGLVD